VKNRLFIAFLATGCLVASTTARADAIDGDWCFGASNLFINGSSVRTPGGNQVVADYDRHGIRYAVPATEAGASGGAGSDVVMRLLNDENAILVRKTGATEAAPETWKRCKPIS
jgi:hypothetical protein